MVKRRLCNTQPISSVPFEAFHDSYWHWIDHLVVKDGAISVRFADYGPKNISSNDLRLQSKSATALDCRYLLRPGMDVCVLVLDQKSRNPVPGHENQPVLQDARITSIARVSHEDHCNCTCKFTVEFYSKEASSNKRRLLAREYQILIDRIYILQRFNVEYRRDGRRTWDYTRNCTSVDKSKLLSGPFGSEFAWLIVLSIKKRMEFCIRLVRDRLIYILVGSPDLFTSQDFWSGGMMWVMILEIVDGKVKPRIEQSGDDEIKHEIDHKIDIISDIDLYYDVFGPRRSIRRKTAPDCYVGLFDKQNLRKDPPRQKVHCNTIRVEQEILVMEKINDTTPTTEIRAKPHDPSGRGEDHMGLVKHEPASNETKHGDDHRERNNDCIESSKHAGHKRDRKVQQDDRKSDCKTSSKHVGRKRKSKVLQDDAMGSRNCAHGTYGSSSRNSLSEQNNVRRTLDYGECDEVIGDCMKKIKAMKSITARLKRKPEINFNVDVSYYAGPEDFEWESADSSLVEQRDHEDLWKEMDHALCILPLLEDDKGLLTSPSNEDTSFSMEMWENSCQHVPFLDEEIGIICRFCKTMILEIGYVLPSFGRSRHRSGGRATFDHLAVESLFNLPDDFRKESILASSQSRSMDVWSLIPELEPKLYEHQKRAFEFLWKNIAGSLRPRSANLPRNSGGCIISHSPGTGKTLLIVSFLQSYLKAFNGRRPLILAPKITLFVWIEEFRKWEIPTPLYTIHAFETYRKSRQKPSTAEDGRRVNLKTMHTLDCLDKLRRWHEEPSILLMSYSSFFLLAQDNDHADTHRKFIADVLKRSPGILILDEGHNPRSTSCKLRILLMQVRTRLRVLLSGTIFQNNFVEYFNTLCLARPRFIHEAMRELGSPNLNGVSMKKRGRKPAGSSEEETARREFVQQVGRNLALRKESCRRRAFDGLMRMTRGFVDVFTGRGLGGLPGLEMYTIIMDSMPAQKEILDKLLAFVKPGRHSWDVELLITMAAIHPSLITSISGVGMHFKAKELRDIARLGKNFRNGSKIRFVCDIVRRSMVRGEKVLIFCHNIPPIRMLVETLSKIFRWQRGREILILRGEQDLFERDKIITNFKEEPSRVLLASTTACSEGISLTAASRVVLMDSEWNHSKTQQAVARAFRPGQERVVYVYQLLAAGTLEEDKYKSNIHKEWLSKMINSGEYMEHSDCRRVGVVDDDVLRDVEGVDKMKIFHYSVG